MTRLSFHTIPGQASDELERRERALAVRAETLTVLEDRLAGSRRRLGRLEDRLRHTKDSQPAGLGLQLLSRFRLPRVAEGYFDASTHEHEDEWWSLQLGTQQRAAAPRSAA
jgi:hypothetical protein